MEIRVVLYTRRGCQLCGPAREVVSRVCEELGVSWREVDIDVGDSFDPLPDDRTDPLITAQESAAALRAKYTDYVPVVVVDGIPQGFWEIDETRLRRAVGAPPQP